MSRGVAEERVPLRLVVILGILTMFGSLSLDLYLPVLPALTQDLRTTASAAQLSLTACLIGLALGQLVAGPLSDRFGRRPPLLVGIAVYVVAALGCALAPTIGVLVALRLVQGLAGSAGIVISRAVARDRYSGDRLLVVFAQLSLVGGLAPIVAPVLGGQLSLVTSWRGMFVVLTGLGVVILVAAAAGLPESLPTERRTAGGFGTTLRGFGELLRDRVFVAVVASSGLAAASLFAYLAGATFVLQVIYGLSAVQFSLVFTLNSLGIVTMSQVGGLLGRRGWPAQRVLPIGLTLNLVGTVALLGSGIGRLPLAAMLVAMFVLVSSLGLIFPTSAALAMSNYPHQAGAASSLVGVGQFVLGGLVAPLVGLGGEDTAVPLGIVVVGASVLASLMFFVVARPALHRERVLAPSDPPPEGIAPA